MGGIARKHRVTALQIGGVEDHIQALVTAPPTLAPSQIAQILKGESSKWIHDEFRKLKQFSWQDGYGAFTVSKSNIPQVIDYIQNQRVALITTSDTYGGNSIVADATTNRNFSFAPALKGRAKFIPSLRDARIHARYASRTIKTSAQCRIASGTSNDSMSPRESRQTGRAVREGVR